MKITRGERLTDEQITILESAGFRRWTKYGKDRLYANADVIGMELDFYKSSGAISHSVLNGEEISHRQASKILDRIDGAYIDVMTGKIYAKSGGHEYIEAAVEAIDDTENEPEEEDNTMKINITYESGPAREGSGSVDYMTADISDLDLERDELYAEVDPYSFLPQMGGTDKLCEMYPEYEEIIREYDPQDTGDLEDLAKALSNHDRDFDTEHFWDRIMHTFLWEADQYTGPYLEAEIIAQAEALGIDKANLVF